MVDLTEAPPREAVEVEPAPRTRRRDLGKLAAGGAVVLSVAYFVVGASLWLNRPGLYQDEVNFVDAALGGFPHQSYVDQKIMGVPVLVIPYIGVVKSALFAPIFALWGVSVETIRIPAIAISALTLVVAYFLGRELIGRWSAILVVLMATCPTFIVMSKVDWGPIVVGSFLSVSVLLAFFRYLRSGRMAWLCTALVLSLVGIFDKQNFVWLIIAIGVGGTVVYRRRLWELTTARPRAVGVAVAAFVFALLVFAAAFVLPSLSDQGGSSLQDPVPHLVFAWSLYENTVGYSWVINWFAPLHVSQPAWMDLQSVFAVAALGVLALRRRQGPLPEEAVGPARGAVFFLIVFAVMLVEVAATREAISAWHVIELLPYPVLVMLCSLVAVIRSGMIRSGNTFRILASTVTAMGLCLILAAQVVATTQYVSLMRNPSVTYHRFSTDVYKDADFVNANVRDVDQVVSGGWGPGAPLFSLACPAERRKYNDNLYQDLINLKGSTAPSVVRRLFGNQRILYVYDSSASETAADSNIEANTWGVLVAYTLAFPHRRLPEVVLRTGAYNIVYFGPQPFHARHGTC